MPETLSAVLHLLVFAYWLGGDVGAFTASYTVTDSRQTPAARLAAARILNQIDMAPRSALILTLPTGVTLAVHRGWLDLSIEANILIWLMSLLWLAALWTQHAKAQASQVWRRADLCIRLALILGLMTSAWFTAPLFLQIKFVCLALAAALGIAIRLATAPMGLAIAQLSRGDVSPSTNRTVAQALGIGRPMVVCIWICLLVAAWAGIAKPF